MRVFVEPVRGVPHGSVVLLANIHPILCLIHSVSRGMNAIKLVLHGPLEGFEKCRWNTEKRSSKTVSKIKSEIGRGNDTSCKAYGTRVRGGGPLCPGARRAAAGTPPPRMIFLNESYVLCHLEI